MHAKFQVAGFQTKRDICHRSLDFVCLSLCGIMQFGPKTGLSPVKKRTGTVFSIRIGLPVLCQTLGIVGKATGHLDTTSKRNIHVHCRSI